MTSRMEAPPWSMRPSVKLDDHLLAAAKLSRCGLWTQDRRLAALAQEQGLAGPEEGWA